MTAAAGHEHTESTGLRTSVLATDDCPLCGSKISRAEFLRIQEQIRRDEAQKYDEERARLVENEKALKERHEAEKALLVEQLAVQKAQEMEAALVERESIVRTESTAAARAALQQQQDIFAAEKETWAAERQAEGETVQQQLRDMEAEKLRQASIRQTEQQVAADTIAALRDENELSNTKLKAAEAAKAEIRSTVEAERNAFYAGILREKSLEFQEIQERTAAQAKTEREAEQAVSAAAVERLTAEKEAADAKRLEAESSNAELRAITEAEVTARFEELVNRQMQELERHAEEQQTLVARLQTLEGEKESAVAELKSDYEQRLTDEQAAKQSALQQMRATLDEERNVALLEKAQEHTRERERWQKKVGELERQLEHKTSTDLGDMTQLQVLDALRNTFPGDQITPIPKGAPGADIRIEVVNNGTICGKIIVDAKNHKAWRSDFVHKLREDQLTEEAEYAVLATTEFPKGSKDFCIVEQVVVTSPNRIVAIVSILREAVIQMNCLRLSSTERDEKTARLYEFIMSEKFRQQFGKVEQVVGKLLQLEVDESHEHKKVWIRRGALINSIRDAHAAIGGEIAVIMQG